MWMRGFALASVNGRNENQRQQSFKDAPASGCKLIVQFQAIVPIFQPGNHRFK